MHKSPSQHPFGHDVELQTHFPLWLHSCPGEHAAQAVPALPHAADVDVTQPPSAVQQPATQLAPPHVHAPLTHASPGVQTAHAAPPAPQAAVLVAVTH
jgi:hypothetical protein